MIFADFDITELPSVRPHLDPLQSVIKNALMQAGKDISSFFRIFGSNSVYGNLPVPEGPFTVDSLKVGPLADTLAEREGAYPLCYIQKVIAVIQADEPQGNWHSGGGAWR